MSTMSLILVHEADFVPPLFFRSTPKTLPTSGIRGQSASTPHHCVSVQHAAAHFCLIFIWFAFSQLAILPRRCSAVRQANPVHLVVQGWRSWQSVGDRGICPGVASSPLWAAECGLGLGGRQEWRWPRTEDLHGGSTQARLNESQRLSGGRRVSRQHRDKCNGQKVHQVDWFHGLSTGYWCSYLTSMITG